MRVLVACEFTGTVRDAFIARGHEAVSCDLVPSERSGPHLVVDAVEACRMERWDLVIAHPPCTYFALSGNRWLHGDGRLERLRRRAEALAFVLSLVEAAPGALVLENPLGTLATLWRRPDQTINPFDFGEPVRKPTCLWLRGVPPLFRTGPLVAPVLVSVGGRAESEWHMRTSGLPAEVRRRERSRTFQVIADAMAEQWGGV